MNSGASPRIRKGVGEDSILSCSSIFEYEAEDRGKSPRCELKVARAEISR